MKRKWQYIKMAEFFQPFFNDRFNEHQLYHEVTVDSMITSYCHAAQNQNPLFSESRFRGYIAGTCGPCGGRVRK